MTKENQNDKVKLPGDTKSKSTKKSIKSVNKKTDQSEFFPQENEEVLKKETRKAKPRRTNKVKVKKNDEQILATSQNSDEKTSSSGIDSRKTGSKKESSKASLPKTTKKVTKSTSAKSKTQSNKIPQQKLEENNSDNSAISTDTKPDKAKTTTAGKAKPNVRRRPSNKTKIQASKSATAVKPNNKEAGTNITSTSDANEAGQTEKTVKTNVVAPKREPSASQDLGKEPKLKEKDSTQARTPQSNKASQSPKEKPKRRAWSKGKSHQRGKQKMESPLVEKSQSQKIQEKLDSSKEEPKVSSQAKENKQPEEQQSKQSHGKTTNKNQVRDAIKGPVQNANASKSDKSKNEVNKKTSSAESHANRSDSKNRNTGRTDKPLERNVNKAKVDTKTTPTKKAKPVEKFIPKVDLVNLEFKNDEFIRTFIEKVEQFLRNEIYIASDYKIVCAVSGGVDSISLLDAISLIAQKIRFSVYVIHFNHKLRGEAAERDEEAVAKIAKKYDLPFYRASGDVKQYAEKNKISIEHAARMLRYNFYERISRSVNADFVATAHNADDSAETFLINLLRGSGLTGLRGIPPKRNLVKNVLLVRPFHKIRKSDIIEYAQRRGLHWRTDETNYLIEYTRNKVRLELLPFIEREFSTAAVPLFNRTAKLISGADDIIEELVNSHLINLVTNISNDSFSVKLNILEIHSRFLQGELIQATLKKYFRMLPQTMSTIDRLLSLRDSDVGAIVNLSGNFFALKEREYITFAKKTVAFDFHKLIDKESETAVGKYKLVLTQTKDKPLNFPKDSDIEYLDYDKLPPILEIRSWSDGDSFKPLGMSGTMNISDFLTNNKVAHIERNRILVLTNMKEIVWVVGMRINDDYKITKDTKKFLKVEFIRT